MEVNGLKWPERDIHCRQVVFNTIGDMEKALQHCGDRQICVQAGGNAGVWPRWLGERFETVYTFEPDAENFRCLVQNVPDNVVCIQAALGNHRGTVGLHREPDNCGAYYVAGAGAIPTLRIDDLGLPACDLIVLDIEGLEAEALAGAVETIGRFRPVLQYEDKGLSVKYGTPKGQIEQIYENFGYRVLARPHRDVILVVE
ncbi:MAG: FkbM family methyltransferase [Geminicoccaceae bacterium]